MKDGAAEMLKRVVCSERFLPNGLKWSNAYERSCHNPPSRGESWTLEMDINKGNSQAY